MAGMRYQPQGAGRIGSSWANADCKLAFNAASKIDTSTGRLSTTTYSTKPTPIGLVVGPFSGSGPYPTFSSIPVKRTGQITVVVYGAFGRNSSGRAPLLAHSSGSGGWKFGITATGQFVCTLYGINDYNFVTLADGFTGVAAIVINVGVNVKLYKGGVLVETLAIGTPVADTAPLVIGNRGSLNDIQSSSQIAAAYYFETALSDAQIAALSLNPWRLYDTVEEDDFIAAGSSNLSYIYSSLGGFVVSGGCVTGRAVYRSTTGALSTSGTSLTARGRVSKGTTGISLGGVTSRLVGALRASVGGVAFSGNSPSSFVINTQLRDVIGSVAWVFRGTGGILRNASMVTFGGVKFSGSGIVSRLGQAYGVVMGTLNDVTFQKLRIMGYVGSRNDMLDENKYWRDLAGGNQTDTLNTVKKNVLRGLGYTGHLNEMEKKYWENR